MVEPRPSLRVVFFGSPRFAVPTLEALLASAHQVVAVVTQPDRPRGRGQQLQAGPVKALATSAGIPVLQPHSFKNAECILDFEGLAADLGVVAAYGKLLPQSLLLTPRRGMINVHASLLPKYRGAAPIHRAVAAGELETGISIMRVVKALDAGPVLATVRHPIGPHDTSLDVERALATLGARLLVDTVDRLAAGSPAETPQDEHASTYAARLTKDDGAIDWQRSAPELHNLVRAMHPWPHAYTVLSGKRIILLRTTALDTAVAAASESSADRALSAGTVLVARGHELQVATGGGVLRIDELQAEGSRAMAARDFLAGHDVRRGDRFTNSPATGQAIEPPRRPRIER
jgi:methionyl-tRNA formyltransferase